MLIQNINSAVSVSGFTGDSASVPVVAQNTPASAPVELPHAAVKTATVQPTSEQLRSAVDNLNQVMRQNNSNVEFSIEKGSNQTVIKVVDSQTGQLISQFPSKEALAVSQMIGQGQRGALVKQNA